MKPTKFDIMRNHRAKMAECARQAAVARAQHEWIDAMRRSTEMHMAQINEITDNLGLPRVDQTVKKSWWSR